MHKFAKQIMECVKTKVEAMGIDNIEGQNLEELKVWSEIAKNIVCYDKDYKIVEAMEESANEDNMRAIEMYDDYPERRYYDNYRYKTSGRFAPKGKGSYMPRRGYEEPPYYHSYPERDMDREYGRMYYTEPMNESGYDRAKRMYTETKEMHKANTPEDKEHKMKSLDSYTKELASDITGMVADMSAEEKNLLRTKLSNLVSKI